MNLLDNPLHICTRPQESSYGLCMELLVREQVHCGQTAEGSTGLYKPRGTIARDYIIRGEPLYELCCHNIGKYQQL